VFSRKNVMMGECRTPVRALDARGLESSWTDLIQRVALGQQPALAELYDQSSYLLFALALRIVPHREVRRKCCAMRIFGSGKIPPRSTRGRQRHLLPDPHHVKHRPRLPGALRQLIGDARNKALHQRIPRYVQKIVEGSMSRNWVLKTALFVSSFGILGMPGIALARDHHRDDWRDRERYERQVRKEARERWQEERARERYYRSNRNPYGNYDYRYDDYRYPSPYGTSQRPQGYYDRFGRWHWY
jgi:hypothetical protein